MANASGRRRNAGATTPGDKPNSQVGNDRANSSAPGGQRGNKGTKTNGAAKATSKGDEMPAPSGGGKGGGADFGHSGVSGKRRMDGY